MPKSKNVEIPLPFSGEGTEMANLNLGGKCQKWQKSLYFENYSNLSPIAGTYYLNLNRFLAHNT